jgi:perosamine synthetase
MIAVVLAERDARSVADAMGAEGIDTRPFFTGAHEQPVFRDRFPGEHYPVTERLTRHGLLLPSSPHLDDAALERVALSLERALARTR